MAGVWFSILVERSMSDAAVNGMLDMCMRAGALGYSRIVTPYARVEVARNTIAEQFLAHTTDPEDTLIMLDCDHTHPPRILEKLAAHPEPVVAALAFRRSAPFDPQAYQMTPAGYRGMSTWEPDALVECDAVGTAAIAIKRKVFDVLVEHGFNFPWFRFLYEDGSKTFSGEDIFFCWCCRQSGVPIYCDTGVISPHLALNMVDEESWKLYLADHPELRSPVAEPEAEAAPC